MATSNTIYDAFTAGIVPITGRTLTNPTTNTFWGINPEGVGGSPTVFEPILLNLTNSPVNLRQPRLNVSAYPYASPKLTDGVPFLVCICGLVQPSRTDAQLTVSLWQGSPSSTTVSNVFSNTPVTMPATISNFNLKYECLWDSGSLILNGIV